MAFTQQQKNGVTFHTADGFTAAGGVHHGFATRLGGVSTGFCAELNLGLSRGDTKENVRENYRRFCAAIGGEESRLVLTRQVHQDTVRVASPGDILPDLFAPIPYEADALVTDDPTLCLTAYYADCIPVLLYDPVKKVVAAVHSGWRGTALGIAPKTLQLMHDRFGSDPANVLAAIGPGIGPCCFETHADVPDAMRAAWGEAITPFLYSKGEEKFSVDLKGIIAWQLRQSGLARLETLFLCTGCHPELYWSHRKQGQQRGNQAVMIQLAKT